MLAAVLMVVLLAMLAFSIDVGYRLVAKTELHRAVDAGRSQERVHWWTGKMRP